MRCLILIVIFIASLAAAHDLGSEATYLGNAGVLVVHGEVQIAFDPLFDEDFDTYDLVPEDMQRQLMDGESPFDSLDAIFVSHFHDDHFDASLIAKALKQRPELQLFAPVQAVSAVLETNPPESIRERLHPVDLDLDGESFEASGAGYTIEAVRVPHGGWPDRHASVENIVFRVTLDDTVTVVHLGDATRQEEFYARSIAFWTSRTAELALPPYWFFLSDGGRYILENYVKSPRIIGVHVPREVPSLPPERPEELQNVVLFTQPGETVLLP